MPQHFPPLSQPCPGFAQPSNPSKDRQARSLPIQTTLARLGTYYIYLPKVLSLEALTTLSLPNLQYLTYLTYLISCPVISLHSLPPTLSGFNIQVFHYYNDFISHLIVFLFGSFTFSLLDFLSSDNSQCSVPFAC